MFCKYKVLCYTYLNQHLVSFIVTKTEQDNPMQSTSIFKLLSVIESLM